MTETNVSILVSSQPKLPDSLAPILCLDSESKIRVDKMFSQWPFLDMSESAKTDLKNKTLKFQGSLRTS